MSDAGDALVLEGVVKTYGGGRRALDDLGFRVPRGVVCGFVGPNGAGKTTTFSVISGFLPPDAGRVDILGQGPFDPWALKGRLGVLPQDAELPDRHTPRQLLIHLGRLQGLGASQAAAEADRRLAQVDLTDRAEARIGTLSHGMRRRVAVASALIGDPELVLLDEPTAGLDPVQARRVRDVLHGLRGERTVVVSSHNLLELETLCDWLVLVRDGRCVGEGSMASMTGRSEVLVWTLGTEPSAAVVDALPAGTTVDGRTLRVTVAPQDDADAVSIAIMQTLAAHRVGLEGMRRGVSLEERVVAGQTPS